MGSSTPPAAPAPTASASATHVASVRPHRLGVDQVALPKTRCRPSLAAQPDAAVDLHAGQPALSQLHTRSGGMLSDGLSMDLEVLSWLLHAPTVAVASHQLENLLLRQPML